MGEYRPLETARIRKESGQARLDYLRGRSLCKRSSIDKDPAKFRACPRLNEERRPTQVYQNEEGLVVYEPVQGSERHNLLRFHAPPKCSWPRRWTNLHGLVRSQLPAIPRARAWTLRSVPDVALFAGRCWTMRKVYFAIDRIRQE